jgi:hypothetical protein
MGGKSKKVSLNVDEMIRAYTLLDRIEAANMAHLDETYAEV